MHRPRRVQEPGLETRAEGLSSSAADGKRVNALAKTRAASVLYREANLQAIGFRRMPPDWRRRAVRVFRLGFRRNSASSTQTDREKYASIENLALCLP